MWSTIPALLLHRHRTPTKCTQRNLTRLQLVPVSDDGTVDTLGGYRLVRKLGSGSSSEVWLGSDGSNAAALKVYRPGVDSSRIDSEIEALGRASSRHLLRLDDLSTGPDGLPCLILQRLSTFSLGRLLAVRQPSAGEAVTILAPLVTAVAELHRVGVAHGSVVPTAVLFDESGAPVLASFGSAELFGDFPKEPAPASVPPALLAQERAVAADIDRLVELCISTLGRGGDDVTRWLGTEPDRAPDMFPWELAERLFSLAAPSPVFLSAEDRRGYRDDSRSSGSYPVRSPVGTASTVAPVEPAPGDDLPHRSPGTGTASDALSMLHLPESVSNPIAGWLANAGASWTIPALRARISAALRPVRKAVWIVAGVVAVAIVAFAAFVPAQHEKGLIEPDAALDARTVPPVGTPTPRAQEDSAASADPTILGDDPVAAGGALLRARAQCFDANSVLCLDGVDQSGSSAMESDTYQIRIRQTAGNPKPTLGSIIEGSPIRPGTLQLAVVERLGDTVLLSLANPGEGGASSAGKTYASLLIIRGDQGWRIRDLSAG